MSDNRRPTRSRRQPLQGHALRAVLRRRQPTGSAPDLGPAPDEPGPGDDGAARRRGELDAGRRHRPRSVAQQPDPSPTQRQQDAGRRRRAPRRPLARRGHRRSPPASPRPRRGAGPSGSSRTRDVWRRLVEPVAEQRRAAPWAARCPQEAQAMAGPLHGHARPGGWRDVRHPGRLRRSAAWPPRCSPPPTSGCRSARPARPRWCPPTSTAFAEGLDVSEDDVLLYLALREAAHQRLFAHVPWLREHLLSAGGRLRPRHHHRHRRRWRSRCAGINPTNPAAIQEALEGGLFEPKKTPAQEAALTRLETTLALVEGWVDEVVGQATARADADRGQDAGGRTPPPRRRRSGRGDLRGAGRTGAAPAPAARRLDAVGLAALPPGHRGPRRRVAAPRPAAHLDRPRRPAGVPRGPRRARARWPRTTSTPRCSSCSTSRTATPPEPDERADGRDASTATRSRR